MNVNGVNSIEKSLYTFLSAEIISFLCFLSLLKSFLFSPQLLAGNSRKQWFDNKSIVVVIHHTCDHYPH